MPSARAFDICLQRIHEAPLARDWTAVGAATTSLLGSDRLIVYGAGEAGRLRPFFVHGEPGDFDMMTSAMCGALAPKWIEHLAPGHAVRSSDCISDGDFERSAFYNELIRPIGDFYGALAGMRRLSGTPAFLATGRRRGRRDFEDADIALLRRLLPHLAISLSTSELLTDADLLAASADCALDRLNAALLVLDARGGVVFANGKADRMLTEGALVIGDGALGGASGVLRRAVARCAQYGVSDTIEWMGADGMVLRAQVSPAPADTALQTRGRSPAVLVIVPAFEPAHSNRANALRHRFKLTAAEAAVALEIANGMGRKAASEKLGVSLSTVRTHLTHVFEKTGVHRQAELAALIARLTTSDWN